MKPLRVLWVTSFLLLLSSIAFGQSLRNVRPRAESPGPGKVSANPGRALGSGGRSLGGPDTGLFVRSAARVNGGPKLLAHLVTDFLRRPDWGLVERQDRFYLFARGAPPFESPEESVTELRDDLLRFRTELVDARRHRSTLSHYLVGKASATRR